VPRDDETTPETDEATVAVLDEGADGTTDTGGEGEPAAAGGEDEPARRPRPRPIPSARWGADEDDADTVDLEKGGADSGGEDEEEPAPAARRTLLRGLLAVNTRTLVILWTLVVAVGAAAVWLNLAAGNASSTDKARTEGLAAARANAEQILSYDYRNLDKHFAAVKKRLTGKFSSEYARTSSQVVAPLATKYHAVVTAKVQAASVVSASGSEVTSLLFVNQMSQNDKAQGTLVDENRVRMTVKKVHGTWKVSDVKAL
jgi:Mce-associated membrane protein